MKTHTIFLLCYFTLLSHIAKGNLNIGSVSDLIQFTESVNSGTSYSGETVFLTNNIDLSSEGDSYPIGNTTINCFQGIFDGQGYVISGFSITKSYDYNGFFGYSKGSTIRNLILDNTCSMSYSSSSFGGMGTSSSSSSSNNAVYGGIVAGCEESTTPCRIESCVSMGTLSCSGYTSSMGTSLYFGGIIGYLSTSTTGSTVRNCANYGSISQKKWVATSYVGGILGYCTGSKQCTIQNTLNYGTLTYSATPTSTRSIRTLPLPYTLSNSAQKRVLNEQQKYLHHPRVQADFNAVSGIHSIRTLPLPYTLSNSAQKHALNEQKQQQYLHRPRASIDSNAASGMHSVHTLPPPYTLSKSTQKRVLNEQQQQQQQQHLHRPQPLAGSFGSNVMMGGIVGYADTECVIEGAMNAGVFSMSTTYGTPTSGGVLGSAASSDAVTMRSCYYSSGAGVSSVCGNSGVSGTDSGSVSVDDVSTVTTLNSFVVGGMSGGGGEEDKCNGWIHNPNGVDVGFVVGDNSKGVTFNSKVILLPDIVPYSSDSVFNGWFTDKGLTVKYTDSTVNTAITLYGKVTSSSTPSPSPLIESSSSSSIKISSILPSSSSSYIINTVSSSSKMSLTFSSSSSSSSSSTTTTSTHTFSSSLPSSSSSVKKYSVIFSEYVEIVFGSPSLTNEEAKNIIKSFSDDSGFVIVSLEAGDKEGETKVIVKFTDMEEAKEFLRNVDAYGRNTGISGAKSIIYRTVDNGGCGAVLLGNVFMTLFF